MQIADQLREQIGSGELALGSALPSESDLMAHYGVARRTVRRATRALEEAGLIHRMPGRGFYAGPPGTPAEGGELMYQRIAADIITQIRAGTLKPDLPLPSETALRERFDVAIGTVRRAVAYLRELGWVFTVPRKGTYVSQRKDWPETNPGTPED